MRSLVVAVVVAVAVFATPVAARPRRAVKALPAPATPLVDDGAPRPVDGRLPRDVTPRRQRIDLDIDPRRAEYRGAVVIDVDLTVARRTIWLHARELVVDEAHVTVGSVKAPARFSIVDAVDGLARVDVDAPLPVGAARVSLAFHAAVRKDLEGLYGVRAAGADGVVDDYVFSQFEALSAREAFPCFDEPGWKIPFTVSVTHPARVKAVGNTTTTTSTPLPDDRTRDDFAETAPLPTYLLAFVVGPVDVVDHAPVPASAWRASPLPLRGIAVRGRGAELVHALDTTARVLKAEERAFAIGYPYDKLDVVAVPDFSAGAMENAGLVTFRDRLLFVDDKSPIVAQKGSLSTIAHELAHQWFGNLVTMAWWDDLWLNEAFATWFAARVVQRVRPDFDGALELREDAHAVMGEDSLVSARRIREPIRNRGDIEAAFDGITYAKGAAVIAMFEEYIDYQTKPGTFMSGVTAYLDGHRFGSGTTADFLAAVSAAAGFDVAPSFSTFLDQPGVPLVRASCEPGHGRDGNAGVAFMTERFLPVGSVGEKNQSWNIPVCVTLFSSGMPQRRCSILTNGSGAIDVGTATCPTAVHPNADGAGYYRFTMPGPQLTALSKKLAAMTTGERLSFGTALRGGFVAATAPFIDTLAAAKPLAGDAQPSVAMVPLSLLEFTRDHVLTTTRAQAAVNLETGRLYQPALNRLGLVERAKDTPKDRERRAALFDVLVDAEQAPLSIAVAVGREIFTTGATRKLAPDLWPVALRAVVQHGHLHHDTWDAWLRAAKTQRDPRVRGWMLHALASTEEARLSERALALVFDDDIKVNEAATGIFEQAGEPATRDAAFAFVTSRWDDITKRLPADWRPALAQVFESFCDDLDAARVESFFAPKVATTPGLDRALAQTLESIRLCAAKKAAHGDAIRAAFGESRASSSTTP